MGKPAILATQSGPLASELANTIIHSLLSVAGSEDGTRPRLQECKDVEQGNELLVFRSLRRAQFTLVAFVRQLINAPLCLIIGTNIENRLGGLGRENSAEGFDHTF